MTITITAGHTSGPITISSGDPLIVLSGGEVYSATILNGGSATLSSGGVGIDVTVSKGGLLVGPGELEANSQDYGDVVRALLEGSLEVRSGGVADEVTVSGGGLVIDANGLTVGTVLSNDGTETISSGGFASGTKVESGGVLLLSAGGTAVAATVSSAGLLVFGGALSANFTYDYGPETTSAVLGGVTVSSGGGLEITGATVLSGATLTLGAGTNVDGLTIDKDAKLAGTGALDGDSTAAGSVSAVTVAGGLERQRHGHGGEIRRL
jgi:autotransporter passenger strand-loop-strand repeat protein